MLAKLSKKPKKICERTRSLCDRYEDVEPEMAHQELQQNELAIQPMLVMPRLASIENQLAAQPALIQNQLMVRPVQIQSQPIERPVNQLRVTIDLDNPMFRQFKNIPFGVRGRYRSKSCDE